MKDKTVDILTAVTLGCIAAPFVAVILALTVRLFRWVAGI